MVHRRKFLVAAGVLGVGALAAPFGSLAQQQGKVRRIGFLGTRSRPDVYYDAFVQGMQELGYVEGKNLIVEWRFADNEYERLPGLAAELVRLNPDVIVTHSTPGTAALHRATKTIPVVSAAVGDPVGSGFAATLARPGGNITGLSITTTDLIPKQVELLKTLLPALSRVAVLGDPRGPRYSVALKAFESAGQLLGVTILPAEARTPEEIERAFVAMKRERVDAVIIRNDTFFIAQRRQTAELAARDRLPSMFPYREGVMAGGLMCYGVNTADHYRRAATYVDKILKGAKPSELPFEQPTKIHFAINRKTAKAIGINVPSELLLRADEVIG